MERKLAEILTSSLLERPEIPSYNGAEIIDLLASVEIPASSRFYEEIPANEQVIKIKSEDRYYVLSLRRVLRNS